MTCSCFAQAHKAKDTYPNGQLKYRGKYIECLTPDEQYQFVLNEEKRKIGKWISYYPSGVISKIRVYTKKVRNCKQAVLREGEWKRFNEDGIQYLSERYSNDTLIFSEVEIYEKQLLMSKVIISDHSKDTIFYVKNTRTSNLIQNPTFDQHFYKPIRIINDGKNQIEELIPYWNSPDMGTPDYYHQQYRKVKGIPEHFDSKLNRHSNAYVGLMLFVGNKTVDILTNDMKIEQAYTIDYAESIQSKLLRQLEKGKIYCFKANILLSRNAGYSINRFGVLFSEKSLQFSYAQFPVKASLSFSTPMDDTYSWKTLCKGFIAGGDEAFITLGRFSELDETEVTPRKPHQLSELDINRSAYYLIDDLQLYSVDSLSACGCDSRQQPNLDFESPVSFEEVDLDDVPPGSRYVLNSVRFDFDRTNIKESFIPELNKLLNYLRQNPFDKIIIFGHTDDAGTKLYNQNLSRKRSEMIKDWLVNNGVAERRIKYEGLGDSMPQVENISEANREINRRVEIELVNDE